MKVGIAGTGKIVREFLNMQKDQERIEVTALVCRPQSEKTGRELVEQYGIPVLYTDYETFLKEAEMDAVYLGIVNQMHAFYAEKALLAGRNVIDEKPFTSTVKEAEKLVRLAREKHLFLLEAITLLHFPNYHYIQEHLKDLGKITMVQANFSQYSSRYDKYLAGEVLPAFDPAASGGSLMDINIYNLHFTAGLFGMPESVHYYPRIGFNGIDTSGTAVLEYPDFHAVLSGAKDSDSPGYAIVQGEKGYIKVNGIPSQVAELTVRINGETRTFTENRSAHRMVDEMLEFDRILTEKDWEKADRLLEHSLTVMKILETARKSGGIHFPADEA